MNWNLEEFYRLCGENDQLEDYLDSLNKKIIRANIMGGIAIGKWNEYFANNDIVDFETEGFYELELEVEMYMEAAFQFIHSTGDILAQILNTTVLEYLMAEHDVSISKVKGKLSKQQNVEDLVKAVDELLQSRCYQYINAFVNTIKHRSLIESVTHAEFGKNTKNKIGLQFQQFKYRSNEYPREYADEILSIYFKELQNLIENVGTQINRFMKHYQHQDKQL
jgi:hypothetical protein